MKPKLKSKLCIFTYIVALIAIFIAGIFIFKTDDMRDGKLNIELTKATDDLSSIDETNKKLATQSERGADEQDIKEASKIQIDATNKDGDKTRKALEEKFSGLTEQDIKEIESFDSYKAQRFSEMAPFMINSEGQLDVDSATFKIIQQDNKKIGYIYISIFASNTYEQFKEKLDL